MTHDELCLGCKCEDGDHWIDCTCRCATISRIREAIAEEIEEVIVFPSEEIIEVLKKSGVAADSEVFLALCQWWAEKQFKLVDYVIDRGQK